jgi:hypothetical protein
MSVCIGFMWLRIDQWWAAVNTVTEGKELLEQQSNY